MKGKHDSDRFAWDCTPCMTRSNPLCRFTSELQAWEDIYVISNYYPYGKTVTDQYTIFPNSKVYFKIWVVILKIQNKKKTALYNGVKGCHLPEI